MPGRSFRKTRRLSAYKGSLGSGDGQFNVPTFVGVDAAGVLYVSEARNNRVQLVSFASGAGAAMNMLLLLSE